MAWWSNTTLQNPGLKPIGAYAGAFAPQKKVYGYGGAGAMGGNPSLGDWSEQRNPYTWGLGAGGQPGWQGSETRSSWVMDQPPASAPAFTLPAAPQPPPGPNFGAAPQNYQVYSPEDIQHAANQARSAGAQAMNMDWLQKRYSQPGISRSAGTFSAALPDYAAARQQGLLQAGQTNLQQQLANALYNTANQQEDFNFGLGNWEQWRQREALQRQFGNLNNRLLVQLLGS